MRKETIEKMRNQIDELCTTCAQDRGNNLCEGCPCFDLETSDCYLVKTIVNMTKQKKMEKENADRSN